MSAKIKLSGKKDQGRCAVIDKDSHKYLNQFKWYVNRYGYAVTNSCKFGLGNGAVFMHRLITNAPKGLDVDHINNNNLDNRRSNLRICTRSQNLQNTKKRVSKLHTSKYKGVYWQKDIKRWRARIQFNNKIIYLGTFEKEDDAAIAYNQSAKIYHQEFAVLNKIGGELYLS